MLVVCIVAAVVCAAAVLATGALDADRRLRLPSRPARVLAIGTGVVVLDPWPSRSGRASWTRRSTSSAGPPPAEPVGRPGGAPRARSAAPGTASGRRRSTSTRRACCTATGPGTFEFAWNRSPRYEEFVRDAHSFYLESLAEEGWLGPRRRACSSSEVCCWSASRLRVRARRDPIDAGYLGALLACFVVYLAYAGYDWMWELTAVSVFGLVAASHRARVGRLGAGRPLDWRARVGARAWSR